MSHFFSKCKAEAKVNFTWKNYLSILCWKRVLSVVITGCHHLYIIINVTSLSLSFLSSSPRLVFAVITHLRHPFILVSLKRVHSKMHTMYLSASNLTKFRTNMSTRSCFPKQGKTQRNHRQPVIHLTTSSSPTNRKATLP